MAKCYDACLKHPSGGGRCDGFTYEDVTKNCVVYESLQSSLDEESTQTDLYIGSGSYDGMYVFRGDTVSRKRKY